MPQHFRAITVASVLLCAAASAQAATEITWWHSMTGALGERVAGLADQFNKSQSNYKVNAVYKGAYDESMSANRCRPRLRPTVPAMRPTSCRYSRSAPPP